MPISIRLCVASLVTLWIVNVAAVAAHQQRNADPPVDPAIAKALMEEGGPLFGSDCAACHAPEGGGDAIGPAMTNNASLASKDHVITRILEGMPAKGMPPFAQSYSDRKIAAVATFIRGAFENAYSPIVEEDVKRVRETIKKP